jgi:hypothetical protein
MNFVKRSTKTSTSTREGGAAQVTTLRRTVTLDRCEAAVTSGTTSLKGEEGGNFRPSWSLPYRLLKFSKDNTSKTDHLHQLSSFASHPSMLSRQQRHLRNTKTWSVHVITSSYDNTCLNCVRVTKTFRSMAIHSYAWQRIGRELLAVCSAIFLHYGQL